MYTGMLPCLVPSWPQIMQLRIPFRSRSDLVLDADHALDFLSDLAFQACISFYSVLDKSGASMFLPCWIKMLGGHFGPEKKYLTPPPPKFAADPLPGPLAHPPPFERPPLCLDFQLKPTTPPLPVAPDFHFPSPKQKKKYPKRPPRMPLLTCL